MKGLGKEMKALQVSTAWKHIVGKMENRKKDILDKMMDASIFAGLSTDTLDENARKQLYFQHLLKIQYSLIEYMLKIPQVVIDSEPSEQEDVIDEYLSIFDKQYPAL